MGLNQHRVTRGLRRIAGRLTGRRQDRQGSLPARQNRSADPHRPGLLIVGHSHIECLGAAAADRPDLDHVTFLNLRRISQGDAKAIATLRDEVARVAPAAICLCLAGNLHNLLGLIENPVPFAVGDAQDGAVPTAEAGRAFIPHAVMRDQIARSLPVALAIDIFAMVPDGVRLYLDSPPPIADLDHVRRFPGVFKDKVDLGFAPNALRLTLYRIQSDVWRAEAMRAGATFIGVDPQLVDEDGFLDSAYFNRDPTHGNEAYGRVMLARILDAARSAA